ncbi:MAG: L-histidine N(alpha)-methyltransferase [Chloroflexi bacterium]|nr:L-histidine N(alpha)-methyltransferase [Chloroflexota bacterium]
MYQPAPIRTEPLDADQQAMLADVLSGLGRAQKSLPSKYFYDEEGSRIFDEITMLPEYYPTRTEAEIMRLQGGEIAATLGEGVLLVEYGSGSSAKTRILLDLMRRPAGYVPVDISGDYLRQVARELQADYPDTPVLPVVADFTQPFLLPDTPVSARRNIVYFPGSTIGNFPHTDALRILQQMAKLAGEHGGVLIGVDLVKPLDLLLAAYNDSQHVTARFNLNLLQRMNRELDANFDISQFRHEAIFNAEESRIEMYLYARRSMSVCVDGVLFHFAEGESILTEYSHKYTLDSFGDLASQAGLETASVWTDPKSLFSVQYLTRRG